MLRSTFSTTTIASSTTMPIASTRPNSDNAFSEKPNKCITASVPTSDTGTAASGITDARQVCRNSSTTSTTSEQRLEQRVHDGVDRLAHEHRRVVDDVVVDALGELLREPRHRLAHLVRDVDRVAAGTLVDRNRGRGLAVEQRAQRVGARAELDARDVAQARDLTVLADLDRDVLELFLRDEPALRVDQQLEVGAVRRRRRAELARGHLHVLRADRAHDVARR